jgi:hypothetical protein
MNITFDELTDFEKGYFTAALWTFDDNPPQGEFSTSGRVQELFPLIDQYSIQKMRDACTKFQKENTEILAQAGNDSQNGHDFYLTRNNEGSGFWDRGYDREISGSTVGDILTDAAHAYGECSLYYGNDSEINHYP